MLHPQVVIDELEPSNNIGLSYLVHMLTSLRRFVSVQDRDVKIYFTDPTFEQFHASMLMQDHDMTFGKRSQASLQIVFGRTADESEILVQLPVIAGFRVSCANCEERTLSIEGCSIAIFGTSRDVLDNQLDTRNIPVTKELSFLATTAAEVVHRICQNVTFVTFESVPQKLADALSRTLRFLTPSLRVSGAQVEISSKGLDIIKNFSKVLRTSSPSPSPAINGPTVSFHSQLAQQNRSTSPPETLSAGRLSSQAITDSTLGRSKEPKTPSYPSMRSVLNQQGLQSPSLNADGGLKLAKDLQVTSSRFRAKTTFLRYGYTIRWHENSADVARDVDSSTVEDAIETTLGHSQHRGLRCIQDLAGGLASCLLGSPTIVLRCISDEHGSGRKALNRRGLTGFKPTFQVSVNIVGGRAIVRPDNERHQAKVTYTLPSTRPCLMKVGHEESLTVSRGVLQIALSGLLPDEGLPEDGADTELPVMLTWANELVTPLLESSTFSTFDQLAQKCAEILLQSGTTFAHFLGLDTVSVSARSDNDMRVKGRGRASYMPAINEDKVQTEPEQGRRLEAKGLSTDETGVFVALGSNLGDRVEAIETACRLIDQDPDMHVVDTSLLYETEPMYVEDQGRFLNGACEVSRNCFFALDAVQLD